LCVKISIHKRAWQFLPLVNYQMKWLYKLGPELALRLGLAGVYLYTGWNIVTHPTGWHWAIRGLPQFLQEIINSIGIDFYLRIQGTIEIFLALVLLAWFLPKWMPQIAGLLMAVQMFLILLLIGLNLETYRDIGILGAGLALFLLLHPTNKSS
jgi:hypothetical protein